MPEFPFELPFELPFEIGAMLASEEIERRAAMLIRRAQLEGIRCGEVTLAFRQWKRPTVRSGGRLRTAIGELSIERVSETSWRGITSADAKAAGYGSRDELLRELGEPDPGRVLYRIRLSFAGADSRIALRESAALTQEDRADLVARLDRLDRASHRGPWTQQTLAALQRRPATLSTHLAEELGMERAWFKTNVRKLKALGLTESLAVGYRISPRGQSLMQHLGLASGAEPTPDEGQRALGKSLQRKKA